MRGTTEDLENYRPSYPPETENSGEGYIQPYGDNPLDGEAVGETVYLNMIHPGPELCIYQHSLI